ncbi:E3 ubiquitin-protein ligase KCMF1 [Drosophila erecta]|uniref:RING-type E3 ubiquitin transferase n=1 Tax=Drosophila erecta TaxID=7220 RepID=B3N5K5_DROER|nr:E3 ubiquitin-protein ligase KCMF1 [Drosophila erecta]EDV57964.1 uncharacterized protein Dere_GG25126 [Drosophila erecta]
MGHRNICCDGCRMTNFRCRRFRCLRCVNYNLCGICYDQRIETEEHRVNHPMQMISDPDDLGLLLNGEIPELIHLSNCFTCPYCGLLALPAKRLIEHVYVQHRLSDEYVVCPMCAGLSAVDLVAIRNLSKHLLHNHIDHANFLEPDTPPLRQIFPRNHIRHRRQSQLQPNPHTGRPVDMLLQLSTGPARPHGHMDPPAEAASPESKAFSLTVAQPSEQRDGRYLLLQWMAQQKVRRLDTELDECRRRRHALFAEHLLISMLCCEELQLPECGRRRREGNWGSDLDREKQNSLSKVMSVMSLPWTRVWQASQLGGSEGELLQGVRKHGVDLDKIQIEEQKWVAAEEAID